MRGADKVKAKKLYAALLAGSLVIPVLFQTPVEAAPKKQIPITININGDKLPTDVDPIMIKGRVMLPLRAIFEQLGASVSWEPKQRKITAYKDGVEMILYLDSKVATINGTKVSLDVAPLGYKARTMVPVRFVSEALGQSVSWQTSTRTVTILTTEDPGNNNNTPPSNNTINPVLNITLSDVANYGDGRDLRVSFGKSTTESLVQSYNVYIVKASSANNFNITSATRATSAGNYTNILATGTDPSTVLSSGAKDVDGDLIRNGQSYVAYVLAVGKGNISNVLSARSSQVTLTNGQSVGVATNVVMSDVSDYGDGRDLSVSFTRPQLDSNIANYRVFIVKTKDSNSFTLAKAVGASSQYYTTVNKSTSSSLKVTLSSSARDTSGDLIKNGVSYTAFVLSVSNNTNTLDHKLSNPSSSLVLNQGTLTAPAITKVEDISDYGDGRDLRVSFNKVSDESRISGYRIFVVKNSKQSSFNLSQANYVSSANYTSVNKTNYNLTQTLSYNTRDTDGDLIRNNISYRVFVMAVGTGTYNGTNTLSSASSLITLNTNAGAVERVSGLYVNDVADYGDGRDLQVSFTKPYNESNISEYRVFVVPTYYGNFDLNQANSLSSYYYTSISKRNANITQVLSSSARDVRGNLIQNNVDYQVYVMSVRNSYSSGDNALSYASSTIRLGNNASVSAVTNLLVADIADFSDGRDLQVRFSPSSNENNLSRYQVYVVKTSKANSFNLNQANSNRYYTTFYKTGSQVSGTLNSDARDTDGDRIQQGVPYTVFVLSVSNSNSSVNNVLSNGSQSITLTDSSVVQAVTGLSANLIGNTGSFGDVQVTFNKLSNENNVLQYRVLVMPSSAEVVNYTAEKAYNVAAGNYTSFEVGRNSGTLNSNDIFGNPAVPGRTYELRVLTIGKDGKLALSNASNQVIMKAPPVQELPTVAEVDASKVNVVADNSTGTLSLNVSFNAPNDTNINSFTVVALPSASGTLPIDNIKKGFQANLNGDKYFALLTSDMNEQTIDVTKPYDLYIVSNAKSNAKSTFIKVNNIEIKTGQ